MRISVLVLDGLGMGAQSDVKDYREEDVNSNTLMHIHKRFSLKNTVFDLLGLLNNEIRNKGVLINKPYLVSKCSLPYEGADSTLGHFAISGVLLKYRKTFLEDIYSKVGHWFDDKYAVEYKSGVISLDDKIFISNNVECDPGLNMNVLGILDHTSFKEILEVGAVVRERLEVCRVIVMGGKGLTAETIYRSIDKRKKENAEFYSGINIPKTNIYDENYRVVHLSRENTTQKSMLSNLNKSRLPISLIGKTANLFPGLSAEYVAGIMAEEVLNKLLEQMKKQETGLIFANIQELDLAGHSQDTKRAFRVLKIVDSFIYDIINIMDTDDVLIIVGDHGNDPEIGHSFHTRENVPIIIIGDVCKERNIRSNPNLCDIGNFVSLTLTGLKTENGENLLIQN